METRSIPALTRQAVIDVVGNLDDVKIADIISTGATLEDLVEAYAWASDETDALADAEKSLSGVVGRVYDILTADDVWPEES